MRPDLDRGNVALQYDYSQSDLLLVIAVNENQEILHSDIEYNIRTATQSEATMMCLAILTPSLYPLSDS